MSEAWKRIDLDGGGLQAANRRLASQLRSRRVAYLLWLGFALGAHRFYLRNPAGGIACCLASLATLVLVLNAGWAGVGVGAAVALFAWALADLWWIDRRVTRLNKALRIDTYLGAGLGAPSGYRGRFVDGEDAQDAAAPRATGFAEQERLLADIARRKRSPH
jgi:TM2 domain-containing membrane protein YozV